MTNTKLNFKDYLFSTYQIPYRNLTDISDDIARGHFPEVSDISLCLFIPGETHIIAANISTQVIIQSFEGINPIFTNNNAVSFDIGCFEYSKSDEISFSNTINDKNDDDTDGTLIKMLKKDFSFFDFIQDVKKLFLDDVKQSLISHLPNKSLEDNLAITFIQKINNSLSDMLNSINNDLSNNYIKSDFIKMKLTPTEIDNIYLILKEAQTLRLQNLLEHRLEATNKLNVNQKI